ncbi:transglycosylase domain-containing protein [Streptomyces luteolus]|uniref:Transglycosylase domain-containing protein n=1 Tax=Streptomyces luteolus TaxID=3043615 RepID=A0ABT6SZD4_9ACTN|nr:transglycosylase domain-containing protein [Streptomyces sp. B-S-A12]MDI3420550.1 transglycosylase domain-containing protein [Streptomyces sp. B-S-A12]
MSEHRRKPPQSQGGGRAAVRRGVTGSPGRRAAPRSATGSPSGSYESQDSSSAGQEQPYEGRAAARRAAQRSGGGRRRAAEGAAAGAGAGRGAVGGGGGRRGGGGSGGPGGPGAGGPGRGRGRGAVPPGKRRIIDYPRAGKLGWRRFVPSWKQVTGTFVAFCAAMMVAGGIAYALVEIPDVKKAEAQTNVFYWDDDTQMAATGGTQNRQIVPIYKIPEHMRYAVISAENATFYKDSGIDPMGIGRAVFNMATGGETQGGSTITQQFVKNTYLDQSQTLTRKARELFISIKVGAEMEKDDVLAGYLNAAYYGRNAYGIQSAAQAYFDKDAEELSLSESAFLAAVLKGPNLYNPDGGVGANASREANTKRAHARWKWILDRMVETGNLEKSKRDQITKFPELAKQKSSLSGQTGYLVDTAKDYVTTKLDISPEELEQGGYKIYTTFNKTRVKQMEKAVEKTKKAFLDPDKRSRDKFVQFGAASVDPKSGAIVALYGGEGMDKGHYTNNANTRGVPVGSTWKPYVLASAMEEGTVESGGTPLSPESLYNGDDRLIINDQNGNPIKDAEGNPFRQKNESDRMWGKVTLRKAMEQSINTPFVQLGIDVGLSKTRDLAARTGILEESFDKGNLKNASFSLGTSTPSAIRMADSYGSFAAEGAHYEPYSVSKVTLTKNGKEEILPGFEKPKRKTAMDSAVANNVTDVLQDVIKTGTGKKIADIGFPVAGKTGTTDKNKSAWFVGYTRELSTSVTLFRTDPKEGKLLSMNGTGGVPSIHGGDIPAQIWKDYMKAAMKEFMPPEPFPEAEKIGEIVGKPTAPPSPTETPDPEDSATATPTEPDPSGSPSGEPSPGESCDPFDWKCNQNGGTTDGGTDTGGTDGGATGGETTTPEPPTGGADGGDSGGGGWFGGPAGRPEE